MDNKAKASRILGIDYGQAKIGLAIADNETKIAFVYGTINNDNKFLQKIVEIIKKENVKIIIIGIPAYTNKEEVEYEGEKLGEMIKNFLPYVKVEYQNEMFTTKIAQENLIQKGAKNIKSHDDEEAARIILQEWLDRGVIL